MHEAGRKDRMAEHAACPVKRGTLGGWGRQGICLDSTGIRKQQPPDGADTLIQMTDIHAADVAPRSQTCESWN